MGKALPWPSQPLGLTDGELFLLVAQGSALLLAVMVGIWLSTRTELRSILD